MADRVIVKNGRIKFKDLLKACQGKWPTISAATTRIVPVTTPTLIFPAERVTIKIDTEIELPGLKLDSVTGKLRAGYSVDLDVLAMIMPRVIDDSGSSKVIEVVK